MEKIKKSNFTMETFWVTKCPECGEMLETFDDPEYENTVYCESCDKTIPLSDD